MKKKELEESRIMYSVDRPFLVYFLCLSCLCTALYIPPTIYLEFTYLTLLHSDTFLGGFCVYVYVYLRVV
jgi:hypothetical protein